MIKFDTSKISKGNKLEMNEQLRQYKLRLKGIACGIHKETDSVIHFTENDYQMIIPKVKACCPEFKERIHDKLEL